VDKRATRMVFLLVAIACAGYATFLWCVGTLFLLPAAPAYLVMAVLHLQPHILFLILFMALCGLALCGYWRLVIGYMQQGLRGLRAEELRWWGITGLACAYCALALMLRLRDHLTGQRNFPMWFAPGVLSGPMLVPMAWLFWCRWTSRHAVGTVKTTLAPLTPP
jgi:hypothetical protein